MESFAIELQNLLLKPLFTWIFCSFISLNNSPLFSFPNWLFFLTRRTRKLLTINKILWPLIRFKQRRSILCVKQWWIYDMMDEDQWKNPPKMISILNIPFLCIEQLFELVREWPVLPPTIWSSPQNWGLRDIKK